MQGEAHWLPVLIVVLGGAALLVGLWLVGRAERSVRHARQVVPCARHGKDAEIVLITDARSGHVIGVDTCSLVEGPLYCDRACLAAAASSAAPVKIGVRGDRVAEKNA